MPKYRLLHIPTLTKFHISLEDYSNYYDCVMSKEDVLKDLVTYFPNLYIEFRNDDWGFNFPIKGSERQFMAEVVNEKI